MINQFFQPMVRSAVAYELIFRNSEHSFGKFELFISKQTDFLDSFEQWYAFLSDFQSECKILVWLTNKFKSDLELKKNVGKTDISRVN